MGLRTKKRGILLWARRIGKDYTCFHLMVERALAVIGQYYYVFPSYTQARKALWDLRDNAGNRLFDLLPEWAIANTNSVEMKILLSNGSLIQLVGSENPDTLRGTNPQGLVFSEFAMANPEIWSAVAKPILAQNGGWAVFASTPMGRNHFYELWQMAETNDDWYTSLVTAVESGVVPEHIIQADREEGMSDGLIAQEYECRFDAGADGLIYGQQLEELQRGGRFGPVSADRSVPVHTAWDLGIGDHTAIVAFQLVGTEIHIVNFYEACGFPIEHYKKKLDEWGYLYGTHFAPHDVEARSLQTGTSLKTQANMLGLSFITIPPTSIEAGIQAVRSMLSRVWIDDRTGKLLLRHLTLYSRHWDSRKKIFSVHPKHDEHSHAADAVRMMALGLPRIGGSSSRSGSDIVRDAYQAGVPWG